MHFGYKYFFEKCVLRVIPNKSKNKYLFSLLHLCKLMRSVDPSVLVDRIRDPISVTDEDRLLNNAVGEHLVKIFPVSDNELRVHIWIGKTVMFSD